MAAYYCTACGAAVRSATPSIDPRYATGRCWTCNPDPKESAPTRPLVDSEERAKAIIRERQEDKAKRARGLHERVHNMNPNSRPKSCPDCRALASANAGAQQA